MRFDNSEPAFPCPEASIERYGHSDGFMGMDIRTTIATKMMQSLISKDEGVGRGKYDTEIAKRAISLAEALIEELNK